MEQQSGGSWTHPSNITHVRRTNTPTNNQTICEEFSDHDEKPKHHVVRTLKQDAPNIALLLLLYTLQGIPMGLSNSIPLLLKERNASYKALATFSLVSWPFSVKLLWAPVVDSLHLPWFGLRKSWIVPAQFLCGLLMCVSSSRLDRMLENTEELDINSLTALFGVLYFLMATQDIAVDGWALSILATNNVGYQSTCNAAGQSIGYSISFMVFMALNSPGFCSYFTAEPVSRGFVTLGEFLWFWGCVFLITTVAVALFKKEEKLHVLPPSPRTAYLQMTQILSRRPVLILVSILLTAKIGFAATDALTSLELMEKGLPKEHLATIAVAITPVSFVLPPLMSKFIAGPRPMDLFVMAYVPRLLLGVIFGIFVWNIPAHEASKGFSTAQFGAVYVGMVLHQVVITSMFVALIAFFAKISDPKIGGTYMTLLATASNFGGNWPTSLTLASVDYLKNLEWFSVAAFGPFYVLTGVCTVLGLVWFVFARPVIDGLSSLPLSAWRV